jgi:predicted membrane protein
MYFTPNERRKELAIKLLTLLSLIVVVLLVGALVYHFTEHWTFLESLYFAAISLTSRGYTDRLPSHWYSIIFSVVYMLLGVSVLIYSISTLISFYVSFYQDRLRAAVKKLGKKKRPRKWVVLTPKKSG